MSGNFFQLILFPSPGASVWEHEVETRSIFYLFLIIKKYNPWPTSTLNVDQKNKKTNFMLEAVSTFVVLCPATMKGNSFRKSPTRNSQILPLPSHVLKTYNKRRKKSQRMWGISSLIAYSSFVCSTSRDTLTHQLSFTCVQLTVWLCIHESATSQGTRWS